MFIDVYITDTITNKQSVYHDDCNYIDFNPFIWEEGNYACDCNRGLFFYNWEGDEEFECGDSRFIIDKIINRGTGEILYNEKTK